MKSAGAALLLALGTAAPIAAQTVPAPPPPPAAGMLGTRLDVVARGEVRRTPDLATISAGVVTQAASAGEALRANAAQMERVLAALKRAGIADRDVQTSSIGLDPQYRYAENQPPVITGYQARNTVNVRFRDIAKAGPILDALVGVGANQINGPSLTLAEPDAALDAARADAIAKAKARAELYARTLGMRVIRVVAVSEGGMLAGPPMPVMAQSFARDAATKIAPGEQDFGVDVTVSFELR